MKFGLFIVKTHVKFCGRGRLGKRIHVVYTLLQQKDA